MSFIHKEEIFSSLISPSRGWGFSWFLCSLSHDEMQKCPKKIKRLKCVSIDLFFDICSSLEPCSEKNGFIQFFSPSWHAGIACIWLPLFPDLKFPGIIPACHTTVTPNNRNKTPGGGTDSDHRRNDDRCQTRKEKYVKCCLTCLRQGKL